MIGYVIGREYGYWLLLRYGGYLWITESRIKLGQRLFLRHGGKTSFSRNSFLLAARVSSRSVGAPGQ
jgi:membrane protein DedA with SNARE-associated domain